MTDPRLKEAEDLLDAVLADQYEGDDWAAIDKAHYLIQEVIEDDN